MMSRRNRRPKSTELSVKQDSISQIAGHLPGTLPVQERVKQIVTQQTTFHGPIPHPDIFRQYGEVVADAPERIMRVFEEDSKHAREIQMAALIAQKSDNRRVHWMAYSLIAGGYILSAVFAWMGKDWLAGILLSATLTGTIAGLIQGKKAPEESK